MHALTVLVGAASVDAVSDLLSDDHGALSVSIEDADAGSPDEQPVFDEPGIDQSGGWRRARLSALFGDEAAATSAAAALAASDARPRRADRGDRPGRRARLGAADAGPVRPDRDRARLLDRPHLVRRPGGCPSRDPPRPRHGVRHRHPSDHPDVPALDRPPGCGPDGALAARARLRLRLGRAGDRRRPVRRRRDRRRRHRPRRGGSDRRQRLGQRGGAARRHGRQPRQRAAST